MTQIPTSDTPASRHQGYMMGLQSVESFVPISLLPENASIVTHTKIYRQVLLASNHQEPIRSHKKLGLLAEAGVLAWYLSQTIFCKHAASLLSSLKTP